MGLCASGHKADGGHGCPGWLMQAACDSPDSPPPTPRRTCVEHDAGKREQVGAVGGLKGRGVDGAVPLRKLLHDAVDLLRLAGQPALGDQADNNTALERIGGQADNSKASKRIDSVAEHASEGARAELP